MDGVTHPEPRPKQKRRRLTTADAVLAHELAAMSHREKARLDAELAELHAIAAEVCRLKATGNKRRSVDLRIETMTRWERYIADRDDWYRRYAVKELADKFGMTKTLLPTRLARMFESISRRQWST